MQKQKRNVIRYRILPRAGLTKYELELLKSGMIPQALPVRYLMQNAERYIELRIPPRAKSIFTLDKGALRRQKLGLLRILPVLQAFDDAKKRFLRPSFYFLSLKLIVIDKGRLCFPILPLGEAEAIRLPEDRIYPDFWQEWQHYYQVQKELADLGRQLSGEGKYLELKQIYQSYLEKDKKQDLNQSYANRASGRSRFPKQLEEHTGRLSRLRHPGAYREQKDFRKPLETTSKLPLPLGKSALAELYPGINAKEKRRKRLALILEDEFIIGRDSAFSDCCLKDPWVGRKHLLISQEKGNYFAQDLFSLNGSFVDGRRLERHERKLLPSRCVLKLGKSLLEFHQIR